MTTIAQLARDTNAQPHEIAAYLDLGPDWADTTELSDDLAAIWIDSEDGIYTPGTATALAQLNAASPTMPRSANGHGNE